MSSQAIRFCRTRRGRLAFATAGDGPALVVPAWWASHLEETRLDPAFRAFADALAAHHTIVR